MKLKELLSLIYDCHLDICNNWFVQLQLVRDTRDIKTKYLNIDILSITVNDKSLLIQLNTEEEE